MSEGKPSSDRVALAMGLSVAAGMSTLIGAAAPFTTRRMSPPVLACSLGFAAGTMLYVSMVEILATKASESFTEAVGESYQHAMMACFFFLGVILIVILNKISHWLGGHRVHGDPRWALDAFERGAEEADEEQEESSTSLEYTMGDQLYEYYSSSDEERALAHSESVRSAVVTPAADTTGVRVAVATDGEADDLAGAKVLEDSEEERKELARMGWGLAVAIAIHNFPEGLATYIAFIADPAVGGAVVLAIALHNIPEGSAAAFPIAKATNSKWRGFMWGSLSGLTEPMGAAFGWAVLQNEFSPWAYGILFAITAGMMTYISIRELLPMARLYDPTDVWTSTSCILGMFMMATSLALFQM